MLFKRDVLLRCFGPTHLEVTESQRQAAGLYIANFGTRSMKYKPKITYDTFQKANNKGVDQTARMRRLVCACVVRKPSKTGFLASRPKFIINMIIFNTYLV